MFVTYCSLRVIVNLSPFVPQRQVHHHLFIHYFSINDLTTCYMLPEAGLPKGRRFRFPMTSDGRFPLLSLILRFLFTVNILFLTMGFTS